MLGYQLGEYQTGEEERETAQNQVGIEIEVKANGGTFPADDEETVGFAASSANFTCAKYVPKFPKKADCC